MGVKAHVVFLKAFYANELAAALEYRFNFITQTLSMFVNDFFWIFFWFIFFQRFESIGGWKFHDMMLLNAVFAGAWGLSTFFFGNWKNIAKNIEQGGLDYFLTLPKNVLLHLLVKMSYSGLGDALFGFTLAAVALPFSKIPLYLFFLCTSLLIILGWAIFIGSLAFYFQRLEAVIRSLREGFLSLSFYPFSVYKGLTRFILLVVIPAGFAAGIPVELLNTFSWKWFFFTTGFSILFFSLSVCFFYVGLKKYESGNVMAMRG